MEMDGSFSKLTPGERKALLAAGAPNSYGVGQPILTQGGTRERTMFVVTRGGVRIERELRVRASYRMQQGSKRVERHRDPNDADRTHLVLQRLGPGEIFGEMSFLVQATATTRVVAEEDSEVVHIGPDVVQRMMAADPTFAGRFYHSLAVTLTHRIRQTNKLVV